jgi:hypothetical protein
VSEVLQVQVELKESEVKLRALTDNRILEGSSGF